MKSRKLIEQIGYDINMGTRENISKYIILAFVISFMCMMFYSTVQNILIDDNIKGRFIDCYIHIFKGIYIYIPSENEKFVMPIMWIILQSIIALFIIQYPTEDLHSYGIQILIRSKNRNIWWLSKCLWVIYTITTVYLVIALIIAVFTFIFGEFSLLPQKEISLSLNQIDFKYVKINIIFYLSVILLPFITSVALSLLQMFLSFVLNPIFSYFIIVFITLSSAYFYNPLLIGNYTMILRSNLIDSRGYDFTTGVIINLCIVIVAIILGKMYFNRYDILKKE